MGLCTAGVAVVGASDLLWEGLSLPGFYLLPIMVAVRFCGRRAGLALCALASAFWFASAVLDPARLPGPHDYLHFGERALSFCLLTVLVDALVQSARRSGRMLRQERQVSRVKSEMLSLVSHEVANSLAMIGLAERELERAKCCAMPHGDGPTCAELCAIIKRNVTRLGLVAQNFLSEARLASGYFKLRPAPVRVDDVLGNVVASLQPLSEDKEQSLSWQVVPQDLTAVVDRDAFSVVLANLIGNAIKYTPSKGRVAVSVCPSEREPDRFEVAVEDTGIGMTREEQARVLSAFERTEQGRRTASGFGLGLKVVHDMVKGHGGALWIASEPGKGSRFSISLPSMR